MTQWSRPERWVHKAQVMPDQCRVCCNRIDTGFAPDGVTQWECQRNMTPPRGRRICVGFHLDEQAMGESE